MIAKKVRVFKDFSGWVFPEKMQVIHRLDALCIEVFHNILWFVGKSGTSFPGSMRLFLHFRVKMCGIAHSVFSGKILRSGKCTGKRENCGEAGHKKGAVRISQRTAPCYAVFPEGNGRFQAAGSQP